MIPDSAIIIDLKGHTLLPGLMDIHTHVLADGGDYEKDLYDHWEDITLLQRVDFVMKEGNVIKQPVR